MKKLYQLGLIYPCKKSRKEIRAYGLVDATGNEYLYPESFRSPNTYSTNSEFPGTTNWRFLTHAGKKVECLDAKKAGQSFLFGKDLSDFLVWRKDGVVAYELATVVDDYLMGITEVVRGEDLLLSSARQCLLFDALNWKRPSFYHCEILRDQRGRKLSKSERNIPRINFKYRQLL